MSKINPFVFAIKLNKWITAFITVSLILCFSLVGFSQNLIPNPGFEDVNVCESFNSSCSREGWKNEFGGKPNYQESTTRYNAHSDSTFAYIKVWQEEHPLAREWMQAKLVCPLKKDQKYAVKLFVKPRYYSITSFGVTFSDTAICDFTNYYEIGHHYVSPLPKVTPSISFNDSSGLIHYHKSLFFKKIDWLELTDTFTAKGTEQYVFIGNFQPFDALKPIELNDKGHRMQSLYLIDDISIIPLDSSSISDCDYEENLKAIYDDNVRHYCPEKDEQPERIADSTKAFRVGKTFVMDNIQFMFDSDTLVEEAFPSLNSLVIFLANPEDFALLMKGHTDSVGSYQYNMELSTARANAVKQYLISKGIDAERLTIKGFGYSKPVSNNDTPEGRKKNRRVEFLIIVEE